MSTQGNPKRKGIFENQKHIRRRKKKRRERPKNTKKKKKKKKKKKTPVTGGAENLQIPCNKGARGCKEVSAEKISASLNQPGELRYGHRGV